MSIRVIIADDHKIVRQGLAKLLEGEKDIEIVGEAGDGQTVMKLTREKSPNVIIMDLAMPHMNGIEATHQISKTSPMTKILVLSMYLDRHYVAGVLGAGASGYLLKDCAAEELVNAVRTVNRGEVYLSQKVSGIIVKERLQTEIR
ncbi:response regulator transcription factor [Chloroflexota bacterium]